MSLDAWAERRRLSGKYLALVAQTLDEAKTGVGYLQELGIRFESLPAPANDTAKPPELAELEQFIGFARARLTQKDPALINSNAGNWPIGHLALRAKAAAGRDKFDPGVFKTKQLLKLGRLQVKKGENPPATTLFVRFDPAFGSPAGVVVLNKLLFSKSDNLPKGENDIENQAVESLRSVLERDAPEVAQRLGFGKHPQGGSLDAEALALQTPAVLEIPLSPAVIVAVQGKQLLIECELDEQPSPESAVHVQHAIGKRSRPEVHDGR